MNAIYLEDLGAGRNTPTELDLAREASDAAAHLNASGRKGRADPRTAILGPAARRARGSSQASCGPDRSAYRQGGSSALLTTGVRATPRRGRREPPPQARH